MSHELPVCLLLPAVSALPLPGPSLKHMLLRSAEQPDSQAQPNAPNNKVLTFYSFCFLRPREGRHVCSEAAISDAVPDLANMASLRQRRPFEASDKQINGSVIGRLCCRRRECRSTLCSQ